MGFQSVRETSRSLQRRKKKRMEKRKKRERTKTSRIKETNGGNGRKNSK